ncbi:hypothetical protein EDB89DRAFT_212286 [Lactarius sanguifluus]|nr:hypothetical protein EDB89DRAFT_1095591 [Lactarius sanguifluus]KAH9166585.1 hypothetical protein EDB89DRAFT_212286 [Lactarius sanguifluus]
MSVELRAKLQALLLRCLTLSNVHLPVGSELLLRAEGLVVLELLDVADSFEVHPAHLVAQLACMSRLERLVVHFRTALPNHKVERTLSGARTTRATLPRLKFLSFHGGSAYLEGILSRFNAPGLQMLSLNFFAQLTFDLPCLVCFLRAAQEFSLSSTAYAEGDDVSFQFESAKLDFGAEAACLLLYSRTTDPGQAGTIMNSVQLRLGCQTLDWQLAVFAQICGVLVPLLERVETPHARPAHLPLQLGREFKPRRGRGLGPRAVACSPPRIWKHKDPGARWPASATPPAVAATAPRRASACVAEAARR